MIATPPRSSRSGLHTVAAWCLIGQTALLAASMEIYTAKGLDVAWEGAASVLIVVAALTAAWAYYAATRTTPLERVIADACLALALLLLLGVIMPPAQYAALALGRPLVDPALARLDAWLGVDVSVLADWTRAHPTVDATLRWGYTTLLWQFSLAVPVLAALRDRAAIAEYVFHFHVCSLVTLVAFAAFPAASAFQYLEFESTLPQARFLTHFAELRSGEPMPLLFGEMEGLISMPSFHVAGALMVTWAVRRHRWLLVPLVAVNVLLCLATFLSGAHYFVDVLAAFAMVGGSIYAWRALHARVLAPIAESRPAVVQTT